MYKCLYKPAQTNAIFSTRRMIAQIRHGNSISTQDPFCCGISPMMFIKKTYSNLRNSFIRPAWRGLNQLKASRHFKPNSLYSVSKASGFTDCTDFDFLTIFISRSFAQCKMCRSCSDTAFFGI